MITIGHVLFVVCVLVTTRLASGAQLSVISRLPGKASKAATVVAGGAEAAEQPSIAIGVKLPVTAGTTLSSIMIVCAHVTVFSHGSPIVHVRVTVTGQVPDATSMYVTVNIPHKSEAAP